MCPERLELVTLTPSASADPAMQLRRYRGLRQIYLALGQIVRKTTSALTHMVRYWRYVMQHDLWR